MTAEQLRALPNEERLRLAVRTELPFSEVCVHMRVAGQVMHVVALDGYMAQLVNPDGSFFSFPITRGEAGVRESSFAGVGR